MPGAPKKQAPLPGVLGKSLTHISLRWHYPDQVQWVGIRLSAFRHPKWIQNINLTLAAHNKVIIPPAGKKVKTVKH